MPCHPWRTRPRAWLHLLQVSAAPHPPDLRHHKSPGFRWPPLHRHCGAGRGAGRAAGFGAAAIRPLSCACTTTPSLRVYWATWDFASRLALTTSLGMGKYLLRSLDCQVTTTAGSPGRVSESWNKAAPAAGGPSCARHPCTHRVVCGQSRYP